MMYSFPNLKPVCCFMSISNCCFLTCMQISQEAGQMVWYSHVFQNFPQFVVILDSSVGKEFTCNAGDPGSIPGLGRSPVEVMGYALQYSWASLVAQLVKNLPAMQETWVWSLIWENPLEKGKATYSSILAWRIPWTVRDGHYWVTFTFTFLYNNSWQEISRNICVT